LHGKSGPCDQAKIPAYPLYRGFTPVTPPAKETCPRSLVPPDPPGVLEQPQCYNIL
jgi:hypothetical protein